MKVAVINFSGNVGKTTIARHLLAPRIEGAEVIAVESINADDAQATALRGDQFGTLQEYLQTVDNVVVDIGASNVEDLLELMRRYRGSHEDFDYFVVPTVPALKQQQDTIATLAELARIGVQSPKVRLVFNQVEDAAGVHQTFESLLAFLREHPLAQASTECRLGTNEVYERMKGSHVSLAELAADDTDYKSLIARTPDIAEKVVLAQTLATRRLACGVVPELDACFAALQLQSVELAA
jgi:MinD-like ATPase involved in chromosome partitioning or flagellar assembly